MNFEATNELRMSLKTNYNCNYQIENKFEQTANVYIEESIKKWSLIKHCK